MTMALVHTPRAAIVTEKRRGGSRRLVPSLCPVPYRRRCVPFFIGRRLNGVRPRPSRANTIPHARVCSDGQGQGGGEAGGGLMLLGGPGVCRGESSLGVPPPTPEMSLRCISCDAGQRWSVWCMHYFIASLPLLCSSCGDLNGCVSRIWRLLHMTRAGANPLSLMDSRRVRAWTRMHSTCPATSVALQSRACLGLSTPPSFYRGV
jgi:hypothetical protein